MKNSNGLLYDFHTHINTRDELEYYIENNIIPVINSSSKAEYISLKKYITDLGYHKEKIYFSIGKHPFESYISNNMFEESYMATITQADIVGEIGMDGFWSKVDLEVQEKNFRESLDYAQMYKKPVVLHTKGMEKKILDIIDNYDIDVIIVHWFSCLDMNDRYIDKGCYFTFGPAIFSDKSIIDLCKKVPLDRILIETDGLEAMKWLLGEETLLTDLKGLLDRVILEIAKIKKCSYDSIYDIIIKNSERIINDYIFN